MNRTVPTAGFFDYAPWMQTILNDYQDAVIITDAAFNIIKWNNASGRLCCLQVESLEHMTMFELLQQLSAHNTAAIQKLQCLAKTGQADEVIILSCPEGNTLQMSSYRHSISISGTVAYVFIIRDMASQIRDHKGAHPVELLYRTMVDTMYEGILLLQGQHGTVLYGNERAWDILGQDERKLVGSNLADINCEMIHENGRPFHLHELPPLRTLRTGKAVENVIVGIKHSNDNIKWLSVNASPMSYTGESSVLAAVTFFDVTEERKAHKDILALQQQRAQELKEINHAVIAAQDHERNELSKELHDNVNQLLSSASILLTSFNTEDWDENVQQLNKGHQYIKMAIQEIRKMSKALNTSVIKEVGLEEPIEDIINNMRISQQMDVQFDYDTDLDDELSNDHKLMVYRIIQEQTNNIIKYAAASEVMIAVRKIEDVFTLTICDNGVGFDMSMPRKGIGLINIRNRVESLNGTIDIISSPDNGCQLEITVPLIGVTNREEINF